MHISGKRVCIPDFVLSIIKEDHRLPFGQYPSPCFLINNKSSLEDPHFVQRAILELLTAVFKSTAPRHFV